MYNEIGRGYEIHTTRGALIGHMVYAIDVLTLARAAPDGELIIVAVSEFDHEHLMGLVGRDGQPSSISSIEAGYKA